MKEVLFTNYESTDGRLFDSKTECMLHEAKAAIQDIARYEGLGSDDVEMVSNFIIHRRVGILHVIQGLGGA